MLSQSLYTIVCNKFALFPLSANQISSYVVRTLCFLVFNGPQGLLQVYSRDGLCYY